uniref:Ankyrin repeat protein n=1 Tax=Gongylonema pulchrum TaxID=637853 RepID=A0A183EMD0_9BILA
LDRAGVSHRPDANIGNKGPSETGHSSMNEELSPTQPDDSQVLTDFADRLRQPRKPIAVVLTSRVWHPDIKNEDRTQPSTSSSRDISIPKKFKRDDANKPSGARKISLTRKIRVPRDAEPSKHMIKIII